MHIVWHAGQKQVAAMFSEVLCMGPQEAGMLRAMGNFLQLVSWTCTLCIYPKHRQLCANIML